MDGKFIPNQEIEVLDKSDNQIRKCKIVQVDDENETILIHYISWGKQHDEWLPFTSPRINPDKAAHDESTPTAKIETPKEVQCKVVLGKLIDQSQGEAKSFFSTYDVKDDISENEKKLTRFNLPTIKKCAELLSVRMEDDSGRTLKKNLLKRVVYKILALMPSDCPECKSMYTTEINEQPIFACHLCTRGSHDCVAIKNFKDSLPDALIEGFVWLCVGCRKTEHGTQTRGIPVNEISPNDIPGNLDSLQNQETPTTDSSGTPHLQEIKTRVCDKFKRGNCSHGISGRRIVNGKTCPFSHPKRCRKFCNFGSWGSKGCKNGISCKSFHPILCKFSVQRKLCIKEGCTYVHLRGTARTRDSNENSYENNARGRNEVRSSRRPMVSSPSDGTVDANSDGSDFLQLKKMIEDLRLSQERELATMRMEMSKMTQLQSPFYPPDYHRQAPMYNNHQEQFPQRVNFPSIQPPQTKMAAPTALGSGHPYGC